MNIAVFSGRFDVCHLGHIVTIVRLSETHDVVIVPVLSYPDRFISARDSIDIMMRVTNSICTRSIIKYVINSIHFSTISSAEYASLLRTEGIDISINCVTYYSGNKEVLGHMDKIGIRSLYVDRSYDKFFSSTIIKNGIEADG